MDIVSGVSVTTASAYPNVSVVETQSPLSSAPAEETVTISAPLRLTTVVPEAVPHVSVEIRDANQRQLVTAIEILSPTRFC